MTISSLFKPFLEEKDKKKLKALIDKIAGSSQPEVKDLVDDL